MKAQKKNAFPPGYYIREYIEYEGTSVNEFSEQIGLPSCDVISLLWGDKKVTQHIAERLEKRTGISAGTWLNLQRAYDEATS